MSHCALETTLKAKRFQFTPETVIRNVFVEQVYRELGCSKQVVPLPNVLCVRGTAHDLSVDERSRRLGPFEIKCMLSAKYGGAWLAKTSKRNMPAWSDTSLDRKPVQLTQNWRDVVPRLVPLRSQAAAFCTTDWTLRTRLWGRLRVKQWITIVQATWYECLDECLAASWVDDLCTGWSWSRW